MLFRSKIVANQIFPTHIFSSKLKLTFVKHSLQENTYYNFLRYLVCGENGAGQSAYQEMVEEYDGMPEYLDKLPSTVYYMIGANPQTPSAFPNTSLRIIDIYNPYDDVVVSTVPDEYRAALAASVGPSFSSLAASAYINNTSV